MRVIKKRTLQDFWERNGDSKKSLEAWYAEAKNSHWQTSAEIKAQFRNASVLKNSRVVFNIHGNKYRLVVRINYPLSIIYIRFLGTHQEYDPEEI